MEMTILKYVLYFFIYSFFGWVYESTLETLSTRKLSNRGFLQGPYTPIYGAAAVIVLSLFSKESSPYEIFLTGMIVATVLEYVTSYVLEVLFRARWWEYNDMFMNINGRICIPASVFFGLMMWMLIKYIHIDVTHYTNQIPDRWLYFICGAIVCTMLTDLIHTISEIDRVNRRIEYVEKKANEIICSQIEKAQDLRDVALDKVNAAREIEILSQFNDIKTSLSLQEKNILKNFSKIKSTEFTDLLNKVRSTKNIKDKAIDKKAQVNNKEILKEQ